ncbi:hypothetical protein [Vibrio vulnificus]|uniref:hypothetical protein n=1 Tax=Vibrio vulnificus TaxID=672 RepID=UPI001FAE89FA|nr:hypothetical protein [Vibrio vulnificus]MCJ0806671.1 hypothetical protein [Vibrio vulnificus]
MFEGKNGCRIPTQREYEEKRRKTTHVNPKKANVRRLIETIEERRGLDALFNYLQ